MSSLMWETWGPKRDPLFNGIRNRVVPNLFPFPATQIYHYHCILIIIFLIFHHIMSGLYIISCTLSCISYPVHYYHCMLIIAFLTFPHIMSGLRAAAAAKAASMVQRGGSQPWEPSVVETFLIDLFSGNRNLIIKRIIFLVNNSKVYKFQNSTTWKFYNRKILQHENCTTCRGDGVAPEPCIHGGGGEGVVVGVAATSEE